MRPVVLFVFITFILCMCAPAIAQGARDTKTVVPDSKVNLYRIPLDPAERAKALNEIFNGVSPGNGSAFMFNTLFTPSNPEQSSLRPELMLNYQASPPYKFQGCCVTRDSTGLRAFKFGNRFANNQTSEVALMYAGGNRVYHWVNGSDDKFYEDTLENDYLDIDGKGAKYFLNAVQLKGMIVGTRMEQLLKETDARRIGGENIRGTRTIVYGIQPTKADFLKGYRYLQVWVRVGDSKIIRTNLDLTYGREFTEYSRHMTNIAFDDERFLLPGETVEEMRQEYFDILGDTAQAQMLFEKPVEALEETPDETPSEETDGVEEKTDEEVTSDE
ncbi:hypothetical protein J7L05_04615 [bacterium]|nr:hypothetical protein [bacterium]